MDVEQIKSAIAALPADQRRKVALFILQLEKDHFEAAVGPQIKEDIDSASKAFQEAMDRLKKFIGKS